MKLSKPIINLRFEIFPPKSSVMITNTSQIHTFWCGRCSPSHSTWEGVDSVAPILGGVVCWSRNFGGNASFWHLLFNMSLQQQYPESFYIIREVALIFGLSNQMTEYKSTKSTKIQNRKVQKYKNAKMLIFKKCKKWNNVKM